MKPSPALSAPIGGGCGRDWRWPYNIAKRKARRPGRAIPPKRHAVSSPLALAASIAADHEARNSRFRDGRFSGRGFDTGPLRSQARRGSRAPAPSRRVTAARRAPGPSGAPYPPGGRAPHHLPAPVGQDIGRVASEPKGKAPLPHMEKCAGTGAHPWRARNPSPQAAGSCGQLVSAVPRDCPRTGSRAARRGASTLSGSYRVG